MHLLAAIFINSVLGTAPVPLVSFMSRGRVEGSFEEQWVCIKRRVSGRYRESVDREGIQQIIISNTNTNDTKQFLQSFRQLLQNSFGKAMKVLTAILTWRLWLAWHPLESTD